MRFIKGHNQRGRPTPLKPRPGRDRFMVKVSMQASGCWLWTGAHNEEGYGTFALDGYKVLRAHRVSWILHRGPIPNGLCVCHHCDTPACVNPGHLFLGTKRDNARDRDAKGRAMQQRPGYQPWNKGHAHERTRVSAELCRR